MGVAHRGMSYFWSALTVALGGGAVVGGAYLASRLKEKQDTEARLDRMEELLEKLTQMEAPKKKAAAKPRPKAPKK